MASYLETARKFFRKKSFDFNRNDIDLYTFHPQLYIFLLINGIFGDRNSLLRFTWPVFGLIWSGIGLSLQGFSTGHFVSIQDYDQATECSCYGIILGTVPVLNSCMILNSTMIHKVINNINKDFEYFCNMGSKYRQHFLKSQLQIWQLCWAWFIFSGTLSGLHVIFPIISLVYQTLLTTQDEHTFRPLQFLLWLPEGGVYKTPIYELLLFYESLSCLYFMQTYCVYIYVFFHVLLHYYIKMDMIIFDFEVLFDGLEESVMLLPLYHKLRQKTQIILNKRIGRIVDMHISVIDAVKSISVVYGPVLVYQVCLSSFVICILAYQSAEKLSEGSVDFLFIMLGSAACVQLWIPCYLGTLVKNKAFAVGEACWNCGWHETPLGRLVRTDIIIIIQQTQKPINIKFTGMPNIDLETYSTQISKAYSYFNMLRQYSKKSSL